jgi:hypothetical protein
MPPNIRRGRVEPGADRAGIGAEGAVGKAVWGVGSRVRAPASGAIAVAACRSCSRPC